MFIEAATNTLTPSSSTLPTSLGVALIMGYILDYLKRLQSIPKISYYTTRINFLIRLAMAGVGTLGVSWVWSAAGTGHQLLITIPAWSALLSGLFHWIAQYGVQHGWEIQLAQRPVARAVQATQVAQEPAHEAVPAAVKEAAHL
jgi:hypothetical protein